MSDGKTLMASTPRRAVRQSFSKAYEVQGTGAHLDSDRQKSAEAAHLGVLLGQKVTISSFHPCDRIIPIDTGV